MDSSRIRRVISMVGAGSCGLLSFYWGSHEFREVAAGVLEEAVSTVAYLKVSPSKAVERLASKGLRAVELSYGNFLFNKTNELEELSRIVDALSRYPLSSFTVHLPYMSPGELGAGPRQFIARVSRWAEVLDEISVRHYVVHLPPLPASEKSIELASEFLKGLLDALGGSRVLVENIPSASLIGSRPEHILQVLNAVRSPDLGVCVDVGHALVAGASLRSFYEVLGLAIESVHVHDNGGFKDEHLVPGTGVLDISELVEFLELSRPRLVVFEVICSRSVQECDRVLGQIREVGATLRSMMSVRRRRSG